MTLFLKKIFKLCLFVFVVRTLSIISVNSLIGLILNSSIGFELSLNELCKSKKNIASFSS